MYALDTNEARKADQTGNRIQEIGKYIGVFKQAEDITAGTGTKGLALRFEANAQTTNLSIYTKKADGTPIMGFQILNAIMACMKLRNIAPSNGRVMRWDSETKKEYEDNAQVFPDLCNKPIGLLLETEDYEKRDQSIGTRMVIAGIFQADTELTASEILDRKTKAEQLPKMVERLRHRPAKAAKAMPTRQSPASGVSTGRGFDDMDDDIPFRDPIAYRGHHWIY